MERLGCTDLLDPYQNVSVAVDYLAEQIDRYGSLEKGLVAYNKGHYAGTVTSYAKTVLAKSTEIANSQYEVVA
jgi:soluble lytic murein transglycosylase-like protein